MSDINYTREEANKIVLGFDESNEIKSHEWKILFKAYFKQYLKKHPQSKYLNYDSEDKDRWESNFKRMVIYERKIMDAMVLTYPNLKKKPSLVEFKKQYGISSVNWSEIESLNEETIYEFREYLNWTSVSKRPFSEDFIPFIVDFVDWRIMSSRYVPENIVRKYHKKLDWKLLSRQGLSQNIMREFEDKVHWNELPALNYTDEFMIEFYDRINYVPYAPKNIDFFKTIGYKNINWQTIKIDHMDDEFIQKKADKLNWELNREKISERCWDEEFIDKYQDRFQWNILPISLNKIKSAKFIGRHRDKINWKELSRELRGEDFITVFHKYVIWQNLPFKKWSDKFTIQHMERLYWPNVDVEGLEESTLRKCSEHLCWSRVSRVSNLSEKFIRDFKNKIDWEVIAHRKDLSKKFRREFKHYIDPYLKDVRLTMTDTEKNFTKDLMDPRNQQYMGSYR